MTRRMCKYCVSASGPVILPVFTDDIIIWCCLAVFARQKDVLTLSKNNSFEYRSYLVNESNSYKISHNVKVRFYFKLQYLPSADLKH